VLFVIVRRRASGRLSAAIAATAALATPLWSTASQALWSHGPAALLLAVGVLAANVDLGRATSSEPASRPLWPLFVAGLAFALAAACRPLLAGFFVGHVYAAWKMRGGSSALAVAVGALVVTLPIAAWNVATFGHLAGGATIVESAAVHQAAHGVSSPWSANPLAGLAGILVSPSRGLLIYMPIALVAVAGAREILKRRALEVWSLLVPTAFFVAGWSMYSVWWGGHSYGPRYAADLALPLALLSVAALTSVQAISRTARASAIAVLSWSLFVQAVGAFSYPGGEWNGTPADVDRAHARLWDWRDSQIPRTVQAGIYRPFVNRLDD
jgi:hypothetical protein